MLVEACHIVALARGLPGVCVLGGGGVHMSGRGSWQLNVMLMDPQRFLECGHVLKWLLLAYGIPCDNRTGGWRGAWWSEGTSVDVALMNSSSL